MTEFERIDRGRQAGHELTLLEPAIDSFVSAFMTRQRELARKEPWAAQKVTNLSIAMNIAEDVRDYLKALVQDGELAHNDLSRKRKIEQMSPEQRRYADAL